MEWALALLVKPLFLLFLVIPGDFVRVLIQRKMPDGKLKAFLLRKAE
jgi:hypothetical protein